MHCAQSERSSRIRYPCALPRIVTVWDVRPCGVEAIFRDRCPLQHTTPTRQLTTYIGANKVSWQSYSLREAIIERQRKCSAGAALALAPVRSFYVVQQFPVVLDHPAAKLEFNAANADLDQGRQRADEQGNTNHLH